MARIEKFGWHEAIIVSSAAAVRPVVRPLPKTPAYILPTRESASRRGVRLVALRFWL